MAPPTMKKMYSGLGRISAATRVRGWLATSATGRTPEAVVATRPYSRATPTVEVTITKGISLVGFLHSADTPRITVAPPVAKPR